MAPAFLLIAAGIIGLVAITFTRESARRPLPGASPIATSEQEARETAREEREDEGNV